MLAILGLILLGLLLPPLVSVKYFHDRITSSIGAALNRRVTVDQVHLRLLPQPGFDLKNFIVADQPNFSAEPMLRAGEVTATLRLSSLWRGRLEIATLSLKQPSLNLVRDDHGLWNIEALLQRASSIPSAPTAYLRPEARPRFPYIEADTGRINFKFGPEKKVYAFTDADFALWLSSDNEWSMRLEARPVRTDINIADIGTVKLDGTFKRAAHLGETPMHFNLRWENAQLGQITKLIYARDRGWRGAVRLDAIFSGTPANLAISGSTSVQDFRRYDIVSGQALRLVTRCSARYTAATQLFSQIACSAPSGGGLITARGTATGFPRVRAYDLAFEAARLPMQSLIAFARHAKQGLPDDLAATGTFNAAFSVRKTEDTAVPDWSASGETNKFSLQSSALSEDLVLGTIPFSAETAPFVPMKKLKAGQHGAPNPGPELRVQVGPFDVPLGAATAARSTAVIARSGYDIAINGDARLSRLLQVSHSLGIRVPSPAADGGVTLALDLSGSWSGFAPLTVTGRAQLHTLTARVRGVSAPLRIAGASVALSPDDIKIQNLSASFEGMGPHLTGSLLLARRCEQASGCPVQFDLHADQLVADELDQLLNPRRQKRSWLQLLSSSDTSFFARLDAEGRISADRFLVRSLDASHVSADMQFNRGKLRVANLRADVLGGHHSGEWRADFTAKPPVYSGRGAIEKFSLGQLSDLMHTPWATGPASLSYTGTMSGWTAQDMFAASTASFHFDWRQGVLRRFALDGGSPPLQVRQFIGQLDLDNAVATLSNGLLTTSVATYKVAGTASARIAKSSSDNRNRAPEIAQQPSAPASSDSSAASLGLSKTGKSTLAVPTPLPIEIELSLKLIRDNLHQFTVTGTLANPHIAPAATPAEASLKR